MLGCETYKEIKDPLFLLNYGIETYFSRNWYETGGYRFTTYGSTGPKGVAAKTSWVTPDPQEIPFRKWNIIAPDKSYTNQSTTLLLKPFQSRALPPGSVAYGYFVVSVIMFTPNGVVVPPQQIRVAGNSLDPLGNAYITTQFNSGYINITPTTGYCGDYQYTLVVTELSPKIELFEPNSKSEITYVDDLDNNADTTLAFVRRGLDKLVVFAKPNLPGAFYVGKSLPGFVLSNGIFDPISGLYKCEINLSVNAETDIICQFGGQYRKLKIVTYDAYIMGCVQEPKHIGKDRTAFGHTWWTFYVSSPAKEIMIRKQIAKLTVFGDCGFWPAKSDADFPKEANPYQTVPGLLVFGDQDSKIDVGRVYPVDVGQIVKASRRLDLWKKDCDSGLEIFNILFRNCTTCYIEFSNIHAMSNIPTSIYKPSEIYKYWSAE